MQAEADRHHRAALDAAALVEARTEAGRQSEAYLAAKLEYIHFFEEASRLRRERIDNMRAELAATLTDGAPCPVCGSLDHPELCELRGDRVTREQEEAADAEAVGASDRAETIGARLGIADAQVSDLSARLESTGFTVAADLISLQAEAARLRAAARDLAAEAAELAELRRADHQAALDDLDRAIAGADRRLAELASQREAELDRATQAGQRAARHRESLLAQLDGAPDLDSAMATARAAAGALTAAADAAEATARAAEDALRAADLAAGAAGEAGFPGLDEARDAYRDRAGERTRTRPSATTSSDRGRGRTAGRPRPERPARPAIRRGRRGGSGRGGPQGPRRRRGGAGPRAEPGRAARRPRPAARRAAWRSSSRSPPARPRPAGWPTWPPGRAPTRCG